MISLDDIIHAIFDDSVKANILWTDIEALLLSLGAERDEGSGPRIRFYLNGSVERVC